MKLSRYTAYDKGTMRTGWDLRHNQALMSPKGIEVGIVSMLEGLETYIEEHQARYESALCNDGVLSEGLIKITEGVRIFLNGELGRLDAGTIDSVIVDILKSCGQEV